MVKEIVEPMFKTMLPGPLAGLHFVKIDLGPVPIKFSQVDVIKNDNGSIQIDMDVSWHSQSDFELDASMIPDLGIEHIHLTGRMSILLAPLTDILPCVRTAKFGSPSPKFILTDCRSEPLRSPSSIPQSSSSTSLAQPT